MPVAAAAVGQQQQAIRVHSEQVLDPLHYLVTLGRRPGALDHSGVYRNWQLPAAFLDLRTALEERHGAHAGSRQFIRVLQLMPEHPVGRVVQAIGQCRSKGLLDAESICSQANHLAVRQGQPRDPNRNAAPSPLESREQEKAAAKPENQGGWMGPVQGFLK